MPTPEEQDPLMQRLGLVPSMERNVRSEHQTEIDKLRLQLDALEARIAAHPSQERPVRRAVTPLDLASSEARLNEIEAEMRRRMAQLYQREKG